MTELTNQNVVNNHNNDSTIEEEVFVFPMSFAQESLWLLEQMRTSKTNYNSVVCLHLVGCLNIPNLEQALREMVKRHEILRTNFTIIEESPVQIIHSPTTFSLPIVDLQNLSEKEQFDEIKNLAISEQNNPFNLAQDFLLRVQLVKLGDKSHVLIIGTHHIICDRWSLVVILKELSTLYKNYNQEISATLPELEIQYADFTEWQRQWLQGDVLDKQLKYWQEKLKNCPPIIELPIDYPRPSTKSFEGSEYRLVIPPHLLNSLKSFSQSHQVTLFITLLTALKILLNKWTGQGDLVVGTVVAGRNRTEIEPLIGCFMNFLALRSKINAEQRLDIFLQEVKTTVVEAYSHQDCPFEKVVESLKIERQLSHNPLYNVALLLQDFTFKTDFSNEIKSSVLDFEGETSVLDLRVEVYEILKGLEVKFEYSTDLFEAETIQRMASNFRVLLEQIVTNPQQKICDLDILTPAAKQQLLVEFNQTETEYPLHKCIHQLFVEQVEKTPNHLALVFEDQQLTYAELNHKANQLAHYLPELGIKTESLVGICLERSVEMVIGLFAILKAGGAYVPIDPTYPADRLNYLLEDSQVPVLLTQSKLKCKLADFTGKLICLDTEWSEIEKYSTNNPEIQISSDNLIYVIYTSGSTGKPKGVMNIHRALVNRLLWMQDMYKLDSSDRVLQKTPFSFDVSVWEFFWTLITGATLVVAKPEGHKDPDYLVDLIQKEKITTLHFVPSMLQVFIEAEEVEKCQQTIKKVICSGEALPYDLQERFFAKLPQCELHNLYGPTEAAIDVSYWQCQPHSSLKKVPIGKPIANTQLYILDPHLQLLPVGVVGELHIGGEGLARGYLNRPELTEEKFIHNPFSQKEDSRLYKTGDLCRFLADGNIEYIGRIDYQVKIRGFRIELGEIEATLTEQDDVKEAIVINKTLPSGDERLTAFIVPNIQQKYIVDHLSENLEHDRELIERWEEVFDTTYNQSSTTQDSSFNIVGWDSSYDGLPIPGEQMEEWLNHTVDGISRVKPQRVLEIGCGTGMILARVASKCEYYYGTDLAQQSIKYVKNLLEELEGDYSHVQLAQKSADDFIGFERGDFDAIVLNSVIQYFPHANYLFKVLANVIELISPQGFIYLGDLRNLNLLKTFHTSIELYKSSDSTTYQEIQKKVRQAINQEEELLIAPEFFYAIAEQFPQISHIQIQLKRGKHHNELTRFRYDVILHINKQTIIPNDSQYLDWVEDKLSLSTVQQLLLDNQPDVLVIRHVPNARIQEEYQLTELLHNHNGQNPQEIITKEMITNLLNNKDQLANQIDPEIFWCLSKEVPYIIDINWSIEEKHDSYDVIFHKETGSFPDQIPDFFKPSVQVKSWQNYINNPLQGKAYRQLIPDLRQTLQKKLPDYMIPSHFVILDALPLNANGKADRKALLNLDIESENISSSTEFVAPRTQTEDIVAKIWKEVLGLEKVGVHDNFFDLGGHSLLATQVVSRIKNIFSTEFSLQNIFTSPTIEEMADFLDLEQLEATEDQMLAEVLAEIS